MAMLMGISSARLRVLLVEDDEAISAMYKHKLELDEYRVDLARDGEEGLRMALRAEYDLIFLDIQLPKLDGFAVLERLRARKSTRHTPVIILSNLGLPELRARGRTLGALEFLIKSHSTPGQLSGMLEALIPSARPA